MFVYKVQLLRCFSKFKSSNPSADGYCGLNFSNPEASGLYLNFLAQTLDFMDRR